MYQSRVPLLIRLLWMGRQRILQSQKIQGWAHCLSLKPGPTLPLRNHQFTSHLTQKPLNQPWICPPSSNLTQLAILLSLSPLVLPKFTTFKFIMSYLLNYRLYSVRMELVSYLCLFSSPTGPRSVVREVNHFLSQERRKTTKSFQVWEYPTACDYALCG